MKTYFFPPERGKYKDEAKIMRARSREASLVYCLAQEHACIRRMSMNKLSPRQKSECGSRARRGKLTYSMMNTMRSAATIRRSITKGIKRTITTINLLLLLQLLLLLR
jgi:hypothetical protein